MNAIPTNRDTGRLLAEVGDWIAEYNHLPALTSLSVHATGRVVAYTEGFAAWGQRGLATWAQAFCVPVTLDMTMTVPFARCHIVPAGRDIELITEISAPEAMRIAAAAGIQFAPGGVVIVAAEQMLAALDAVEVAS